MLTRTSCQPIDIVQHFAWRFCGTVTIFNGDATILAMRCLRTSALVTACVSLLAVQLGGLHMHVDADGNVGGPRGNHLHTPMLHSHGDVTDIHRPSAADHLHSNDHEHPGDTEHAGDNDISMTEMSAGKWNLSDFNLIPHRGLLIARVQVEQVRPARSHPRPAVRKSRWRPPLRAPPPVS